MREVAERQLCTAKCVFYRAEPEFLLQGGMPAVIKPNQKTTPGPMMVQGMVGWAGELMATCSVVTVITASKPVRRSIDVQSSQNGHTERLDDAL